ncbi:MAG: hypothetical protein KBA26_05585 [Candidatus Delongbacteria bacterium]|nr:hypothetical protein [Candidatus Delongbacteria bacterium]
MEDTIALIVTMLSICYAIRIFFDYRLKRMLIDKNMAESEIRQLITPSRLGQPINTLKWGMISISLGLALFITLNFGFSKEMAVGLVCMFIGTSLVISYILEKKDAPKSE